MPNSSSAPIFTIQTASLFASGDTSTFTGTGGPAAFDPFVGEFSDIVSSAGLANESFQDEVYSVDAGDQVTFVIAVQNFGNVAGYSLKLRDTVPVGFALPDDSEVDVTDGAGNPLDFTGGLFDPTGGLTVTTPVAAFDNDSGANVVLVYFTATAANSIALPGATLTNNAQIVGYAAASGGPNLVGSGNPAALSASTPVQTGTITVSSAADQPAATLQAGQTASFDITITLPEGSSRDLRIDEILPQVGTSWLQLASAQIVSVGSHLSASAPVMVQPSGAIQLGTVVDAADNLVTAGDDIVVRVTVAGGGTTGGSGSIDTVVSTADPGGSTTRVSQTITNTVAFSVPDATPSIAGTSAAQFATSSTIVIPFQNLVLSDPDVAQVQTLTIHLSDPALGTLSGAPGLTTNASGDVVLSGTIGVVQALAQSLLFTPSSAASGTETFGLTLNDGAGGIATGQAVLTVAAATPNPDQVHFPISTQTVLTSTATGTSTYAQVETYAGAISNLNSQFLYDGNTTLAIVAQQSGMLISSQAPQTAVQLQGGTNVLDMKQGSSFMVGGAGSDTFLLHVDQPQTTWNTIANFHSGDNLVLYGFDSATSAHWWSANDGAAGYTGATLRIDVDGDGSVDSSLTFAGKTLSEAQLYPTQTGNVGGLPYLLISAT